MDRSLDDMIVDRQRARSGRNRGGRHTDPPRDGIRKVVLLPNTSRDTRQDIDKDWVHDRYNDDRYSRPARDERYYSPEKDVRDRAVRGTRVRVENLHYELAERDINELFGRIGPVSSFQLLYDRAGRSRGVAYVTYDDSRDADDAIREFDGANAYGQPIYLTIMPSGPSASLGPRGARSSGSVRSDRGANDRLGSGRSLFDRVQAPRRARSSSPDRRRGRGAAPDNIDRYIPGDRSGLNSRGRSPPRRRGDGRRPGERRDGGGNGRGGRRGPPKDDPGRQTVQGRPRKTAEELDAEMTDYFRDLGASNNGQDGEDAGGAGVSGQEQEMEQPNAAAPAAGAAAVDEDVDMIQ